MPVLASSLLLLVITRAELAILLLVITRAELAMNVQQALGAHLARLLAWAIASITIGLLLMVTRWRSAGWRHFGVQSAAWGAIDALIAIIGLSDKQPPDIGAALQLREFLWLNEGLNAGYIAVGLTLAIIARRRAAPSPALSGAGWGVAVQGAALLALDTYLLTRLPAALAWINTTQP